MDASGAAGERPPRPGDGAGHDDRPLGDFCYNRFRSCCGRIALARLADCEAIAPERTHPFIIEPRDQFEIAKEKCLMTSQSAGRSLVGHLFTRHS